MGIPGEAPQKGCPAENEFRTGHRDKSPQGTTRGLELRFLPIMYDFIPDFCRIRTGHGKKGCGRHPARAEGGTKKPHHGKRCETGCRKFPAGQRKTGGAEEAFRSARCGIIRPRRSGGQRSGHRYPIGVSCGRQPGKDCTAAGNYTGITEERVCGGRGQPKVPGNSRE